MFRMLGAKASRHLFLFDKMLLIVKKKEEGKLSYKGHITCSNLMLIESIQGEPLCFHVIPFNNPRLQYTFQAHNLKQKREWCLELKRVILENYNAVIPSKARQLVMELGQNKETESGLSDKSNSKRHLSAPEYLEKRKQERRKSEISLNKTFKLKKGNKKNDMLSPKGSPAEKHRGRKFRSASHDATAFLSVPSHHQERRASFDIACSPIQRTMYCFENANKPDIATNDSAKIFLPSPISTQNEGATIDMDDESSLSDIPKTPEKIKNENSHWNAWNNLPDETTDTEIEDNYDKTGINRILQHCPPLRQVRTEKEMLEDLAGEYVTFVFAHRYACRDLSKSNERRSSQFSTHQSYRSTTANQLNQSGTSKENRIKPVSKSASSSLANITKQGSFNDNSNKDGDYDNLINLWYNLETTPVGTKNSGEICSTMDAPLWKQNAVIQRVHSYTSITKVKVPSASLDYSHSFRQPSTKNPGLPHKPKIIPQAETQSKDYEELTLFSVPPTPASNFRENLNQTVPAMCLTQRNNYFSNNCRSFHKSSQFGWNHNVELESRKSVDYQDVARSKMRVKTNHNQYGDHQSFIGTSKRSFPEDFMDDLKHYMASSSHTKHQNFRFPVNSRDTLATCATTPAASIENMSLHPEHRLYRQVSSRYATLRAVISSISSKISVLKVNLGYSMTDQSDNESMMSHTSDSPKSVQLASHSGTRSDQDTDHKVPKTHISNSFVRVCSTTKKQQLGKDVEARKTKSILNNVIRRKNSVHIQKPGSSVIGARIAGLHEAEYCVPSSLFVCHKLRSSKEIEVRPDSLLSNSSNITSSSDGDKFSGGSDFHSTLESLVPLSGNVTHTVVNDRETLLDNSEDSEDSFYERSFEAIEGTMSEDLFRDSAIYSDPDNADLSTEEFSPIAKHEEFLAPCEFQKNYKTKNHIEDNNKDLYCLDKLTCGNNIQNCEKLYCKTNLDHPEQTIKDTEDVEIKKDSNFSELTLEKVHNTVPRRIEILSTRPVNVAIIQKFKNLRENNKFQKELTPSPADNISIENKKKETDDIQKTFIPSVVKRQNFITQRNLDSSLVESFKTIQQKQQDNIKNQKEPSPSLVEGSTTNQQRNRNNTVIQKECTHSLVCGLKSIQQRWCTQKSNQYIEEDESSSEFPNPCLNTVTESVIKEVTTLFNSVEPFDTQPLPVKGWVKHIVSKFQNES
ncbi:uncharacterized protein LOC106465458 [Limulus polyphemus]|uniref:Uncharacterized protein LOC106465458 n=1 Tax=Limulus polyphemus TaxID=6850 RepID=A0ABM1BFT4_LIMPO|nr:uncharacterized protein LOC106465458 [Limulus polyphemus]